MKRVQPLERTRGRPSPVRCRDTSRARSGLRSRQPELASELLVVELHLPAHAREPRDSLGLCARRSVSIAGWCITPGFALASDEPPVLLRELLREAADCRRSILEEPARRTFRPPGLGDLRSQIVLPARSSRPHNGMPSAIGFTRQVKRCERHNGNHRLQSRSLKPRAVMSVTPPTVSPASAPGSVFRTSQTSPSGAVWRSSNICSRARSTDQASYFLSRVTIAPTDAAGMSRWRKKRFLTMGHNAANPTGYLDSPTIAP